MKTIREQIIELIDYARSTNPDPAEVLQKARAISAQYHEHQKQREFQRGTLPPEAFYSIPMNLA